MSTHSIRASLPAPSGLRLFVSIVAALALAGCDASINSPIEVADGESVSGGLTTVNGSITIGRDAEVAGASRTVNGGIRVDDDARVGSLNTVNGSVRIARAVDVDGDVETVNGSVRADAGTEISGGIETINGGIDLEETTVGGDLETRNGEITLRGGSVAGDIVIKSVTGSDSRRRLDVELFDGAVVEGRVRVEDRDREVRVTLEAGSEIRGGIDGAEVVERAAPGGLEAEAPVEAGSQG